MITLDTLCFRYNLSEVNPGFKGNYGLMDKVSAPQRPDRGFEPHMGHVLDSSYDTSTGWFQEADSRVINTS